MFNIPTYFETLFNLSKRNDWTTPKNLSESLTLLLFPNVKAYEYSGFYNKFYNGKNKGVLVYEGSQNEIKQVSHDKYIFKMADNFRSLNFKNKNFNRKRRIIGYLPIKNAVIYTENIKYKWRRFLMHTQEVVQIQLDKESSKQTDNSVKLAIQFETKNQNIQIYNGASLYLVQALLKEVCAHDA